jgi:HD-GYP domain-containing protein (c-di-GMP phosphodiesterase class II)
MSVQKEKVSVQQLQFGMFITELDRPWLESPFLLQGFLLDNEEQMEALKRVCEFVYVDRTKSVGDQFGEKAKINVSIKRTGFSTYNPTISAKAKARTAPKVVVKSKTTNQQKSIKNASFYEIISAIKSGDVNETSEGVIFNIREISPQNLPQTEQSQVDDSNSDSGGTFSFLKNMFKKKEKFKDTISAQKNKQNQEEEQEDYRVVIHENEVPSVEQELAVIYPTFAKSQKSIKALFESIANAQKLDLSTVSEILDSMVESITRTPDALMWLSKLKSSHDGAYNHALNVSINTMAFASFLAMPKTLIKEIGLGGLLQSVGKTTLPKHILEKTSTLTKAEYEIVKTHVVEGLKLLKNNPDIPATALEMVAQHHERYDGSGYPKGLRDAAISIHGQIGGLLDTYCALTTNRKHAHSVNNMMALDEMRIMRDKEFSSELIDQLIQFLGIYPVSSLVELNTGEVAVVIQQNQVRRLLPRVMVVLASDKSRNKFPITLDLLNAPQTPTGETYQIIRSLAPNSFGLNADELYI